MITKDFFETELDDQISEMGNTPTVTILTGMGENYNVCRIVKITDLVGVFEVYPAGGTTQKEKDLRSPMERVIWDRVVIPLQQITRITLTVKGESEGIGFNRN